MFMMHGIFPSISFELGPPVLSASRALMSCNSLNYGAIASYVSCSSRNVLSWNGMGLLVQARMWENQHPKHAC